METVDSIPVQTVYNSCNKIPILYNNNNLASDTIDTIILSGGGYLGIIYFGLIKLLDSKNLYPGIKHVYGVSVGCIFALLIILKYTYADAIKLLEMEFDVTKFVTINTKDIFNLPETFGLTEPVYIEQCVKAVLERSGLSPYITMEDLYNHTGIEFNLGVTLAIQNKYALINHITRPDLPVWLAIRMSANLPIIFNPVKDTVFNDFVYDGGHLNNNPIKHYLDSVYPYKKTVLCDVSTQTEEASNSEETNNDLKQTIEMHTACTGLYAQCNSTDVTPNSHSPGVGLKFSVSGKKIFINNLNAKKYKMNFICIDLKINRMQCSTGTNDLDKITLMDYLVSIISKFTYNQDSYKLEFQPYMLNIDCGQFPELAQIPFTASNEKIKEICEAGYELIHDYYDSLCVL